MGPALASGTVGWRVVLCTPPPHLPKKVEGSVPRQGTYPVGRFKPQLEHTQEASLSVSLTQIFLPHSKVNQHTWVRIERRAHEEETKRRHGSASCCSHGTVVHASGHRLHGHRLRGARCVSQAFALCRAAAPRGSVPHMLYYSGEHPAICHAVHIETINFVNWV